MKLTNLAFPLGILSIALSACSADEQLAINGEQGTINYSVNAANPTRAAHSFCANQMPPSFKVWADFIDNGSNKIYIDDDVVNHISNNQYQSDELRYWPENVESMNFYAYIDDEGTTDASGTYSETSTFKYNSGNPKFENFTVNTDVTQQKDLMYAVARDVYAKSEVVLNFRHALSQICYKAQNENPYLEITVNSVKISGLVGKGTYNFPTSGSTDANYTEHPSPSQDDETLTRGNWDIVSSPTTASYDVSLLDASSKGITIDNSSTYSTNLTCDSHVENVETDDYGKVLNLIPQTRSAANSISESSADGAYFTLNLSIVNIAKDNEGKIDKTDVTTASFDIPASINWAEGYRYIYTFKIPKDWDPDNNALNPITFSVTTDDYINVKDELPHQKVLMRYAKGTPGTSDYQPALYFATTNIGASTPYETGKYFWWGDLMGHELAPNTITSTSTGDQAETIDKFEFKKENTQITTSDLNFNDLFQKGIITNTTNGVLKFQYDAARANWGDNWRIPTKDEIMWLANLEENGRDSSEALYKIVKDKNCKWTWHDGSGSKYKRTGIIITSNETNGEIFLPTTGYFKSPDFGSLNRRGFYWTSSISGDYVDGKNAIYLNVGFYGGATNQTLHIINSFYGHCIRPVWTDEEAIISHDNGQSN
ncbi:MAG: fimbrillin family protein [Muribaculum sp.]|nr:fimbrillin family protein [Muribaculum sp.]